MIAVIGMKKILSESEESDKENLSAVAGLSFPK
jgi:hypothetical protein